MKKLALALLVSSPLYAAPILQDLTDNSYQVQYFSTLGQSFTAEDASIESIGFYAMTFNPHHPFGSLTLNLFAGNGFAGALLGTTVINPVAGSNGWVDADFSSVNLAVGQQYTFQVAATNGSPYWGLQTNVNSAADAYTGGSLFIHGAAAVGDDMRFRVTPTTTVVAAVPEPTTLALMGLGTLSLLALRRRRS